jgi:formate/nitrite transporter FocA (FNT family)
MNSPAEIAKNYISTGESKCRNSISKMIILAIFAGMFIAIAGVGATVAAVSIKTASVAKLVSGLIFPTGLAMVLVAGSELFTGNNLIIISVLEKRISVAAMLKNWLFVLYRKLYRRSDYRPSCSLRRRIQNVRKRACKIGCFDSRCEGFNAVF